MYEVVDVVVLLLALLARVGRRIEEDPRDSCRFHLCDMYAIISSLPGERSTTKMNTRLRRQRVYRRTPEDRPHMPPLSPAPDIIYPGHFRDDRQYGGSIV